MNESRSGWKQLLNEQQRFENLEKYEAKKIESHSV